MKILHIITGLVRSGAETVLWRLVTADTENRHVIISLGSSTHHYVAPLRTAGIEVHTLDMPPARLTAGGLRRLAHLVRTTDAEVVQTWMYHADLIGGLATRVFGRGKPLVWGIRRANVARYRPGSTLWWLVRLNARLSYRLPALIVCCAEAARRSHARIGYDAKRLRVVVNGYDLSKIRAVQGARASLLSELPAVAADGALIGMVGRWQAEKNHAGLLESLGHLARERDDWHAVLVGQGVDDANDTLRALVNDYRLGPRVSLLGPRGDVTRVMSALDVHLLSSHGEGFPNVVAEAMACGTPSVVTDVGDAAAIVGDTGLVVRPGDVAGFAKAVGALLDEDRDRRDTRRACCRERVERCFGLERMVAGYNDVWKEALAKPPEAVQ